jgi:hypothetical protein
MRTRIDTTLQVLRFQNNKCPICRTPFHSLLQIRVLRAGEAPKESDDDSDSDDGLDDQANAPPGFSMTSIVKAVTGSLKPPPPKAKSGESSDDGDDGGGGGGGGGGAVSDSCYFSQPSS